MVLTAAWSVSLSHEADANAKVEEDIFHHLKRESEFIVEQGLFIKSYGLIKIVNNYV